MRQWKGRQQLEGEDWGGGKQRRWEGIWWPWQWKGQQQLGGGEGKLGSNSSGGGGGRGSGKGSNSLRERKGGVGSSSSGGGLATFSTKGSMHTENTKHSTKEDRRLREIDQQTSHHHGKQKETVIPS